MLYLATLFGTSRLRRAALWFNRSATGVKAPELSTLESGQPTLLRVGGTYITFSLTLDSVPATIYYTVMPKTGADASATVDQVTRPLALKRSVPMRNRRETYCRTKT